MTQIITLETKGHYLCTMKIGIVTKVSFCRYLVFAAFFLLPFTSCKKEKEISLPSVVTVGVSEVTPVTAKVITMVTYEGGAPVTATGCYWGTTLNPGIGNNVMNIGAGTGVFTSILTGLLPNTVYHVRAFATNKKGTAFGADIEFTTPN